MELKHFLQGKTSPTISLNKHLWPREGRGAWKEPCYYINSAISFSPKSRNRVQTYTTEWEMLLSNKVLTNIPHKCVCVCVGGDVCERADMLTYTAVSRSQSLVSDCLSSLLLFLRCFLSVNLKLTVSQVGLDCLGNELPGSSCLHLQELELQVCMPYMVFIWALGI